MTTVAIVVTYNRKELLQECIDALLAQRKPVEKILVINNASTDGTEKLFEAGGEYNLEQICLCNMEKNLGGAGGFCEGVKLAVKEEFDWIWIMDDDTIPTKDALKELFASFYHLDANGKTSFLASSVYGIDGEPMNVPEISDKTHENGYKNWYTYLGEGMVKIKTATFVSILVRTEAVKKVGIPFADYFIWGDDTEYTRRLTTYYGSAYMCGKSRVIHKRFNSKVLSIENEENEARLPNYYYLFRNNLINADAYDGKRRALKNAFRYYRKSIHILFDPKVKYRVKKSKIIRKGIWCYLFKKYDHRSFLNRLDYYK